MDKSIKPQIIGDIWQVSRYHGNLLGEIEVLFNEERFLMATMQLLLFFENACRYRANDYDGKTIDVYKKLLDEGVIASDEHEFINGDNSIRQIRNFLMHKNQSRYNFVRTQMGKEILYPFAEQETWKWFYAETSVALFSILHNIFCEHTLDHKKMSVMNFFKESAFKFKLITPEELLKLRGYNEADINNAFKEIDSESERYRIAENASDVGVITAIFSNLLGK